MTGPAASITTEMEETANAGDIVVSSATRAALPQGSATRRQGDGWLLAWRKPRPDHPGWGSRIDVPPDAIAIGLPVALRSHLEAGPTEPEHHIATVGFVKFHGVDALMAADGPAAVATVLDDMIRIVQEAVDAEGVTFLASDIDRDGRKIILVAGAPSVQQDDEGRVLRAGRRIIEQAGVLPVRVGINRSDVYVGEVGTDFRATYAIIGDSVNLAARLMAAAPVGAVYASPSALDRSRTLFESAPLEPFAVKRKREPSRHTRWARRPGPDRARAASCPSWVAPQSSAHSRP